MSRREWNKTARIVEVALDSLRRVPDDFAPMFLSVDES